MISTAAGPHTVVAAWRVVVGVVVASLIWPGVVGIPLGSLKISAATVPSCCVTPSPSARISTEKFQWFFVKDWKVGTPDRFTFRSCHWRYRHNRSRRDYLRTGNVACRESGLLYGTMDMVELWCVPSCYYCLDIRAILTSCISVEAQDQRARAGVRPGRKVWELSSS